MPRTVHLDEWTFVGIQERDIVTGPDQSREYQLTQFLPVASRHRTDIDRVNHDCRIPSSRLVEPAGRLATVRCLVNVQCEGASVVESAMAGITGLAGDGRTIRVEFAGVVL